MAPTNVRAHRADGFFELDWPDGIRAQYPFRLLRQLCPCAGCVDEFSGVRKLDPASVAEDITLDDAGFTGNYALKIRWSDGHDTGLFTWSYLRELRDLDAVTTATINGRGSDQ